MKDLLIRVFVDVNWTFMDLILCVAGGLMIIGILLIIVGLVEQKELNGRW